MIAGWKKTSADEVINIKEEKEVKKIKEDIRKGKSGTEVSVPFSKFPFVKWVEWWEDCKKNFGGCRWAKAYMDHQKAKESKENEAIWKKINELEGCLQQQPEEKEEVVTTLGGNEHE